MTDFAELLGRLSRSFERARIPLMIIGGQAVLLHGEPRLTQDIDVTLGVDPEGLGLVLGACAEVGLETLPDDVTDFVRSTFVLPVADPESGIRVDLIFSNTHYEAQAISRATLVDVGGALVPFATPEDLIIHKLFAGRARDVEDARGVVRRKGAELDWDYMRHWAVTFSEVPGRETITEALAELRAEA